VELTHEFTVPASIEETWRALNDIEGVAGCFPGAKVTSVEGDSFQGTCKVKLGPIALTYNGSGEFTGKDESAHTMTLAAKGKDKRGNGTAGADVTASMTAEGDQTRVKVVTDLQITGKPAQFGRGVIQDVSDKLLGQFADCLAQKLAGPAPEEAAAPETAAAAAAPADQDAGPASEPTGAAAAPAPEGDQDAGAASAPPSGATSPVTPIGSATSAGQRAAGASAHVADEGALDLGATLLPILVKSYGKQIGAGLGVLFVLVLLRRLIKR
jgi:carbon monoxide dehydrogenase subunit G